MRVISVLFSFSCLVLSSSWAFETTYWFPENPSLEFERGKAFPCMIGVRNGSPLPANASLSAGHLAFAEDPNLILMNFTYGLHNNQLIEAGGEVSLIYELHFHPRLPTREFLLTIFTVVFNQDSSAEELLVFNNTINVVEPFKIVDLELLFLYAVFAGIVFLAGWGCVAYARSLGWIKKNKKTRKTKVADPSTKEDWLKGTFAYQHEAKKAEKAS